ncbi:angiopoietin-1 receptor-like [Palaemon carinicauda]|uniref:angiopoietin-1 receptor-like n=1 Tax=Palaemon carinicauda TaxID=392227 RepID=UPI0035B66D46
MPKTLKRKDLSGDGRRGNSPKKRRLGPEKKPDARFAKAGTKRKRREEESRMSPKKVKLEPASDPHRRLKRSDIRTRRLLGEGSYGRALRCRIRSKRVWIDGVLKVLKDNGLAQRQAFFREAECLEKLAGIKGVPVLYGRRDTKSDVAIAMSYNGGYNLSQFMRKYADDVQRIFGVLAKVTEILGGIHRKGLGHNDLHAGNVMIEESVCPEDPVATIIDFGFCLLFGTRLFPRPVKNFEGYHYDPVLSKDCRRTSPKTDIFSFGKLLEKIPGFGENQVLKNLVSRSLSKDTKERPSLEELSRTLRMLQNGQEVEKTSNRFVQFICNLWYKVVDCYYGL